MKNGDIQNMNGLVYSKASDKAYCFCCKLFGQDQDVNQLSSKGFNDWKNDRIRLSQHETSHCGAAYEWVNGRSKNLRFFETCSWIDQEFLSIAS